MKQCEFKRFDFNRKPNRQWHILRPITWALSYPTVWKHRTKIEKIDMDNLKPPYILLCNHNAFFDFKVATAAIFPKRANYIVAIDGFIKREWLLRAVGCIGKRKFTNDIALIRNCKCVIENKDILVIYPEARYSLCGTNAVLPESLGKLIKMFKVPVVTLITHGNHINSPVWNLTERGNRTEAELKQIIKADEIDKLSVYEINKRINDEFVYDDFQWQKENKVKIDYKDRAKGLHKVLYQCPNCMTEYRMNSEGTELWCSSCNKHWNMNEFGELEALDGKTEFSHIPDWYEFEREQVRKEVQEGRYSICLDVRIDSLPNSKGYINLGEGKLVHNCEGFLLTGFYANEHFSVEKNVKSMYSCHIEYDYLGKYGDCIDLSTLTDTYYIYPYGNDFSVTKIALATEELYKYADVRVRTEKSKII